MTVELLALLLLALAAVGAVMVMVWTVRLLGALARAAARPFRRREPHGAGAEYERMVRGR